MARMVLCCVADTIAKQCVCCASLRRYDLAVRMQAQTGRFLRKTREALFDQNGFPLFFFSVFANLCGRTVHCPVTDME